MKNPRKRSDEPIQTVSRHHEESSKTAIVLPSGPPHVHSDVELVLSELDALDSAGDGGGLGDGAEEDTEEEEEYDRTIWIDFPEEIRVLYHLGDIEIPIRKLLKWAAAELPDDAATINEIREEYYGGDQPEDYDFGVSEFCFRNFPPTIEELAIKRVARAAGRKQREALRLALENCEAEEAIRSRDWQIDQLESRSSPFDNYMERTKNDEAEFGEMYRELHEAWDSFVVERQQRDDPEFNTKSRAKLMMWKQKIDRACGTRRIVRENERKAIMAEKASATKSRNAA
ncbi:hypothetical protein LHFGNBLO_002533 [Mesorhizobium sp. AR10]|uniref:hypothetical protein n=1 Tax=Mesorhizobium sp. AR10 TaxID=2865839 RepID=UPI00215E6B24|nr:hypothetical protein [Mesorhizobium sp. AR10]UVK40993.1 hypothetical protein LHFGNBLO_002533 [Mesorhizobium sp. AR10]